MRTELLPHGVLVQCLFLNMALKYTLWYLLQYARGRKVFYDYNYFNLTHDCGMSMHFDSTLLKTSIQQAKSRICVEYLKNKKNNC
jgi:hypothetical protein